MSIKFLFLYGEDFLFEKVSPYLR